MGISEGLPDGAEVDCSAGTIVWVRRRNGSWWPGRILGSDELSSSHLMSPRSGTPVKLLGREDASVDWYNLEKSKRVKAFRCGDFDECIERAESSQGFPIKKREKYARREDAILHALELEKLQLGKKQLKFGIASNFLSEEGAPSECAFGCNEAINACRCLQQGWHFQSRGSDSSMEEQSFDSPLVLQKGKNVPEGPEPCYDDDNAEVVPRMRGLQDLGLRTAPPKRKFLSADLFNSHQEYVFQSHASDRSSLSTKRRRLHGGSGDELLVRRRDRRRPLLQVLQSSARLPSCHSSLSNGDTASMLMQRGREQVGPVCRAKRSKCVYLPAEPGGYLRQTELQLQNAGNLGEENTCSGSSVEHPDSFSRGYSDPCTGGAILSDSPCVPRIEGPVDPGRTPGKMEAEGLVESSCRDCGSLLQRHEYATGFSAIMGGSKWQLKGKRNARNITKRQHEGHRSSYDNRCSFMRKLSSKDQRRSSNCNMTDSDEDIHIRLPAYWEESEVGFNHMYAGHLGSGLDSTLIDVDLKVQASYQGERVPLVSLMSRLNGKAIVGHPVQIEVMQDGSSALSVNDLTEGDTAYNDGNAGLPPMWRTGRRTTMHRVPRSRPSSGIEAQDVDLNLVQYCDPEHKLLPHSNHLVNRVRLMKRSYSNLHSRFGVKLSRKMKKKLNISSQKTRALSSLALERQTCNSRPVSSDVLIKLEEAPPPQSCIPVNLVFSRILEAVGKPQSSGRRRIL